MAGGYVRKLLDPRKRMGVLSTVPLRTGDLRKNVLADKSRLIDIMGTEFDYLHVAKDDRVCFFDLRPNTDPSHHLVLELEDAEISTRFTSGGKAKQLRPSFYLPYQQNQTARMKLKEPATYAGPEVRFFATATIDGCSVYVEGPPETPKVTHSNAQQVSPTRAIDSWPVKRGKIRAKIAHMDTHYGHLQKAAAAVVERPNYIADKPIQQTLVKRRFAMSKGIPEARVLTYAPFGAVVGVKDGTTWSFYLQKCGSFNYKPKANGPVLGAFFVLEARRFWPDGGGVFRTLP